MLLYQLLFVPHSKSQVFKVMEIQNQSWTPRRMEAHIYLNFFLFDYLSLVSILIFTY